MRHLILAALILLPSTALAVGPERIRNGLRRLEERLYEAYELLGYYDRKIEIQGVEVANFQSWPANRQAQLKTAVDNKLAEIKVIADALDAAVTNPTPTPTPAP